MLWKHDLMTPSATLVLHAAAKHQNRGAGMTDVGLSYAGSLKKGGCAVWEMTRDSRCPTRTDFN